MSKNLSPQSSDRGKNFPSTLPLDPRQSGSEPLQSDPHQKRSSFFQRFFKYAKRDFPQHPIRWILGTALVVTAPIFVGYQAYDVIVKNNRSINREKAYNEKHKNDLPVLYHVGDYDPDSLNHYVLKDRSQYVDAETRFVVPYNRPDSLEAIRRHQYIGEFIENGKDKGENKEGIVNIMRPRIDGNDNILVDTVVKSRKVLAP